MKLDAADVLFHIVLVHPEIPQNTGNIGRLCSSLNCRLHLIKPLGFSLDDRYVKRAGMDYWRHVDFAVHEDWTAFLRKNALTDPPSDDIAFFSTKGRTSFWEWSFPRGGYLVFGSEGGGFPEDFYHLYQDRLRAIPMPGRFHRSLNLANAVAVAAYEGLRRNVGG